MRILVIAHPIAGIDREKRAIVQRIVDTAASGKGKVDVTYTLKPGSGKVFSSRAALEGYDAVYAAGGDGTVNDVVTGLVGRSTPLGIIPVGTGNGLARSLGIPFETEKLVEMFRSNKTIPVDVGKISSHYFIATAGIGFDAAIADDFNQQKKRTSRKPSSYTLYAVKNYFTRSSEHFSLVIDGRELERRLFALTIANTQEYGSGARIAPSASPTSGTLVAVLIPKYSLLKALSTIFRMFKGTLDDSCLEYIEFTSMKIKRKKAGIYHTDGEIHEGGTTLNVAVFPGSVNVIVP
jgi:YegS/Rv2252/BmrU family lipid kinase